jgi:hypothetical protein
MRYSGAKLSVLAALLLLIASGCGGESQATTVQASQASRWLPRVQRFLSEIRSLTISERLQLADDAARARVMRLRVRHLIEEAPTTLTREETEALNDLWRIRNFYSNVADAVRDIDINWIVSKASVQKVATDALGANERPEWVDYLTGHGGLILKDVVCNLAWELMQPDEQRVIVGELYDKGFTRGFVSLIKDLASKTRDEAIQAIMAEAEASFVKLFVSASVVDWVFYATGLYDKGTEVTADGNEMIIYPNGAVSTRAMLYYAKLCLSPPGLTQRPGRLPQTS